MRRIKTLTLFLLFVQAATAQVLIKRSAQQTVFINGIFQKSSEAREFIIPATAIQSAEEKWSKNKINPKFAEPIVVRQNILNHGTWIAAGDSSYLRVKITAAYKFVDVFLLLALP